MTCIHDLNTHGVCRNSGCNHGSAGLFDRLELAHGAGDVDTLHAFCERMDGNGEWLDECDGVECSECQTHGWVWIKQMTPAGCPNCHGVGWLDREPQQLPIDTYWNHITLWAAESPDYFGLHPSDGA